MNRAARRDAGGNWYALERGGRVVYFLRLSLGGGARLTRALPYVHDEGAAEREASELGANVRRLRSAGHGDMAAKWIDKWIDADGTDARAEIRDALDRLLAGSLVRKPVPTTREKTFKDVGELWTNGTLARDYPDHVKPKPGSKDDDESRLEVLAKTIGDVPIARFTLDDADRAMRKLPDRVRSAATRRQYAQVIARVLSLAVYPLRLRTDNPIPRGWRPKGGGEKAKAYLYPADDAKLMRSNVALCRRLLSGFLAREGMREGEALALRWSDLDLDRGTVRLDENKTDDARMWALGPDVVAALAPWKKRTPKAEPSDPVFLDVEGRPVSQWGLAEQLRSDLRAAGVDREELFTASDRRLALRVHDLRATFVTLALAAGRSETWVADRTGHRSSTKINRYRRQARTAAELGLGWLKPLDLALT